MLIFVEIMTSPELLLGLIRTLLMAAAGLITVGIAARVWGQTRNHFEIDKTQRFIERWSQPAFAPSVASMDGLSKQLSASDNPTYDSALLIADKSDHSDFEQATRRAGHNLLQELGASYKRGVLHNELYQDIFSSLVPRYYEGLAPYLLCARIEIARASLLEDWEWMAVRTKVAEFQAAKMDRLVPSRGLLRDPRAMISDTAVFGYGSLVNPDSAASSIRGEWAAYLLGRMWPAKLREYTRSWNYRQDVALVGLSGKQQQAERTFLGLAEVAGGRCPGVLLPVLPEDLDRLGTRERKYKRVDVTRLVEYDHEFLRARDPYKTVYAFVPIQPEKDMSTAVIAKSYVEILQRAQIIWGDRFSEYFGDLDNTPDAAVLSNQEYRFMNPEQQDAARS